ncbi:MAG: hypothetical protein Q9169_003539 [Polycauliona sp. 2 TL-2023]
MSDSDLSFRPSLVTTVDVDTTCPRSSRNLVLGGSQAGPKRFTLGQGHQASNSNPSCHSHPEPISLSQAAVRGVRGRNNDKDVPINVTTAGHRYNESLQYHDLVSKSTNIAEYLMLADRSSYLIPNGPMNSPTDSAPHSFVPRPPTESEQGNKRAARPITTTLEDDPLTAAKIDTPVATPLRQAHLNSLLASLIPSGPSLPSRKHDNRIGVRGSEDSFDSGSEKEAESDIDFEITSITPSVRSKSPSPVPTPPESDYEQPTKARQPAKLKEKIATPVNKRPRRSVFGDWPIASQARRRSTVETETPVLGRQNAESSFNGNARPRRRDSEASAAPDPLTTASHTYKTGSPNMVRSKAQNQDKKTAKKRAWEQMLESEANADREIGMLEEIEKQKRALVATREETNSLHDVANLPVDDGEVRNGSGWTLVVDRDRHGKKIVKWTVTGSR